MKDAFIDRTGGAIDVFLSSDGQSIPFGRNWIHRVEEALTGADLMFVFVTPRSQSSTWLYFESGFAYSKGIRVIPVALLGARLEQVPPPLGLLQGFNINSEHGLNNLIAICNEAFKHKHSEAFGAQDYSALTVDAPHDLLARTCFGEFAGLVDQVTLNLSSPLDFESSSEEFLAQTSAVLHGASAQHVIVDKRLESSGLSISAYDTNSKRSRISVALEGSLVDLTLPLVLASMSKACKGGVEGKSIDIEFNRGVVHTSGMHKQSGRLYGTGVTLVDHTRFQLRDLLFSVSQHVWYETHSTRYGATYVRVQPTSDPLDLSQLSELVALLFEREVLLTVSLDEN